MSRFSWAGTGVFTCVTYNIFFVIMVISWLYLHVLLLGSATRVPGKVLIFSGADGQILSSSVVPDGRESYYSPVLHQSQDGTTTVLFGTGGETHGGALWYITLHDLYKGNIDKVGGIFCQSC